MAKAKVCMLTTDHPALTGRIFYKEARSLQQAGYDVTLLAPLDDEGFLFDTGRNKIARGETTLYDVRIVGFNKGKRGIPKIGTILQLMRLASLARIRIGAEPFAELIGKGTSLRADVYHCHEVWSLYAGIGIKRRLEKEGRKPKLIYDVHEYTPATYLSSGRIEQLYMRLIKKIVLRFEKKALKYVDYAITANDAIRDYLLSQNRFVPTEVIYNCSVFSSSPKPGSGVEHKDKVIICHEGFLRFDRGLKQMVEVMKVLKECYGNKVELLIIGDVYGEEREYLDEKLEEYELHDTIRRTGWLPYEKVGEAVSQADIGIIFFEPTENNMFGTPHKLFNYMRYGLPIVSVDLPGVSRIISEAQCGLLVGDRNVTNLAGALSALIDDEDKRRHLGENARKAAYNQYSWEQMERKLFRIYEELLSP